MTSVLSSALMPVTAPKTRTTCSLRVPVQGAPIHPRPAASVLAASKPTATQNLQRLGPVQVQAFAIIPLVVRLVTGGVLFYASMNWAYYRGMRKDAEKYMDEIEKSEKSRLNKLDKLTSGKASTDNAKK